MRPRSPFAAVALALGVALAAAACTPGGATEPGAGGDNVGRRGSAAAEFRVPDVLADPGVAPGVCEVVTYTPPTAAAPQKGELCRPATNQRDVAVMVVHGGSGVGGSYEGMRAWANRLMAEGYVAFLPDYTLFKPGGAGPVFPLPEQNIKAAVQYLRGTANALDIDRDHIVVQGMSAGARLGSVAYATPDDPWFAGPERWDAISDQVDGFIGFYHPYDGSMQYSLQYYGGPDDSPDPTVRERWDKADALAQADRAAGPALFITGDKDWSLITEQQQRFADALQRRGVSATTVVIPGGGHGFDEGGAHLSRLGERAAAEVLRWLNDRFPQDPTREAQTVTPDTSDVPTGNTGSQGTFDTRQRATATATTAPSARSGAGTGGAPSTTATTSPKVTPTTAAPPSTTKATAPPTTAPPTTSPPTTTKSGTPGG